jgi:6-phosphogluconolactonase (cycloisomerase 2 family)
MKKLPRTSTLLVTLLLVFTVGTVLISPISSLAQPPGPGSGSDYASSGPAVDFIQTKQSQRGALDTVADGYLYALRNINGGANLIYGFKADPLTGALTALSGFPITTGELGLGNTFSELVAYDSTNSRLFAVNNGSDTISAYIVNHTDGGLIELPYSPFSVPQGTKGCIAVHPSGSPLLVSNQSQNNVASFNITFGDVTEAVGSPYSTSDPVFSCAFSQDGSYVYVGGESGTGINGFAVDAAIGVLTPLSGSPFPSGADYPLAYATDVSGRLFSANYTSNQVRGFTTSSGIPTGVSGNPFTSGLIEAIHGVLHPDGYYMVADRGGNQVGVYAIGGTGSASTLTAVSGSPFASGGLFTDVLALSHTAEFLFAANGDSRNITTYTVNSGTGELSGASTQPVNTLGTSGRITGMAFAPYKYQVYLPVVVSD